MMMAFMLLSEVWSQDIASHCKEKTLLWFKCENVVSTLLLSLPAKMSLVCESSLFLCQDDSAFPPQNTVSGVYYTHFAFI